MDDESRAFKRPQHTFSHCSWRRRVVSPASLREEHEDGKDDLPRNDLELLTGSNRVRGKQTGTGRGAEGQKNVPMAATRMGGG